MDLEDAEVVLGKRWNKWTDKEWDEFLEDITPEQVMIPGILVKICVRMKEERTGMLSSEVKAKLAAIMMRA